MGAAAGYSLRDRMCPPASRRDMPKRVIEAPDLGRILRLALRIFDAEAAFLLLAGPGGLRVAVAAGDSADRSDDAIAASAQLFEALSTPLSAEVGSRRAAPADDAAVLEEVVPGRAYRATTPIVSSDGRCIGALCLMATDRTTLLPRLQRRLLAEFGGLLASAVSRPQGDAGAAAVDRSAGVLQEIADREADGIAIFDAGGRCLLFNQAFAALVASPPAASPSPVAAAVGCEAAWLALQIARDQDPVRVHRSAGAEGRWICVEERRGPNGSSLVARVETCDAFGSAGEAQRLFERCPFPMLVLDRGTNAVLDANGAALAFYGWDRAVLDDLSVERDDPAASEGPDEIRARLTRTGQDQPLALTGRGVDLFHNRRPAVLMSVSVDV